MQETAEALTGGGDLDKALDSYRRVHRRRRARTDFLISDLATARPANPLERTMYRRAVTDDEVWHTFEAIGPAGDRRRPVRAALAARLVRPA